VKRGTDIDAAVVVLRAGGLVAFPTETVYGLGADASRDDAAAKIFAVKGRPRAHPLIVHLAPGARLDDWAIDVPDSARLLAAAAWPGPLTMILRRGPRVSLATTGGAETVGLRVPAHPLAQELLAAFGGGIAAPSANRFGAVSPTTADHVAADLGDDVDYILDGGPCEVGVESTIVDLSRGAPVLLRPGGMPREAIEAIVGPLADADAAAPAAPGTLASHYAPKAEVIAVEPHEVPSAVTAALAELAGRDAGVGADAGAAEAAAPSGRGKRATLVRERIAVLAPAAAFAAWGPLAARPYPLPDDLAGMARGLYAALRDLDALGVDVVIAALPPAVGLGEAVGDRLRRAAGPRT
jgi:L-threonylcarbamoyladenylate synthase